ncbi:MAG: aminodeoxychorismate synthase component I, partial [Gemmatimonadota bacterium]
MTTHRTPTRRRPDRSRPARRPVEPLVRLDSLDAARGGRSFTFDGFRRAIVAREPDDVLPAIREVERVVAGGGHTAGFIAYEAAPAFEPRFRTRSPRADLPLVWFGVFEERVETAPDARASDGRALIERRPWVGRPSAHPPELARLRPTISDAEHRAALERIHDWIAAGDSYQVNHSFRLRGEFRGSDEALYRRLCAAQRAGYCALLRLPRHTILSASPELFFRHTADGTLVLRPMKGTRPRGRWAEEDDARAAELVASEKERAENLMIVDMLRNDAGRVARFGSVEVPELFRVERYPTVHQLTSAVRARTRPGTTLEELLRALFPSGSVTGAPKIRTSEIIAELEDSPRGVYTGAIGFASPDETVFGVAIRTLTLDRETDRLELGVGAGITADSDPDAEWDECLAKAAFVRRPPPPDGFRLLESLRLERDAVRNFAGPTVRSTPAVRDAAGADRAPPAEEVDDNVASERSDDDASGGFRFLDAHLARAAASARYFDFAFDVDRARDELLLHGRTLEAGTHKVRLLIARDGGIEVESEPIDDGAGSARADGRGPIGG